MVHKIIMPVKQHHPSMALTSMKSLKPQPETWNPVGLKAMVQAFSLVCMIPEQEWPPWE
jgi:hypothetical protein